MVKSLAHRFATSLSFLYPIVASLNFSTAICTRDVHPLIFLLKLRNFALQVQQTLASFAMLAPMRTQQLIPSVSAINLDIMHGPSILTSMPLMREIASAPGLSLPTSFLHIPSTNWWGVTKTSMFASLTDKSKFDLIEIYLTACKLSDVCFDDNDNNCPL